MVSSVMIMEEESVMTSPIHGESCIVWCPVYVTAMVRIAKFTVMMGESSVTTMFPSFCECEKKERVKAP